MMVRALAHLPKSEPGKFSSQSNTFFAFSENGELALLAPMDYVGGQWPSKRAAYGNFWEIGAVIALILQ